MAAAASPDPKLAWHKLEPGDIPTTKIKPGEIVASVLPDPTPEILDFIVRYWEMRQASEQG